MLREVIAQRERILDEDHPAALTTRLRLARLIADQGRFDEAEKLTRQVLTERYRIQGAGHRRP